MHRWVANDWSKVGDRDVNGYIDVMRHQVKGGGQCITNSDMYVEKRKKYRWKDPWTMVEGGNWVVDGIAGRARKMAEMEEKEWVASRWTNGMRRWIGESGWAA
jgi:hypothetical protein